MSYNSGGSYPDPYSQQSANPSYQDPYAPQSAGYSDPYAANPYAGQAGGVQPYNNGYAAPAVLPDHPQATMVMILGILGLVVVQLCAPFAWYIGSKAKKEIAAGAPYRDGGQLQAGWIMGIIGSVLLILTTIGIIIYVIFVVVMLGALANS